MDATATREMLRVLGEIPEPRRHNFRHKLIDILTVALFAVVLARQWPKLKGLARLENTREAPGPQGMQKSVEHHYYILTLDARRTAQTILSYLRGHWSVENNLHWQLDVSFREDERRIRKGHGAENFSRLCRMALNLIKNDPTREGRSGQHPQKMWMG